MVWNKSEEDTRGKKDEAGTEEDEESWCSSGFLAGVVPRTAILFEKLLETPAGPQDLRDVARGVKSHKLLSDRPAESHIHQCLLLDAEFPTGALWIYDEPAGACGIVTETKCLAKSLNKKMIWLINLWTLKCIACFVSRM